jgi:predicted nucleic acid-binding protein
MMTTTLVIAEGHGWFLRRYDRTRALQFLAMIEAMTPLAINAVSQREQSAATELLRRFSDQDLTLADASLQLMETHGIRSCWSTDFHLGLTGVPLVIHGH